MLDWKRFSLGVAIGLIGMLFIFSLEHFFRLTREPVWTKTSVSDYVQFDIRYGLEPKPNLDYFEYGERLFSNSDALYGHEIGNKKSSLRILHLGDSFVVGPGIAFEDNYPARLSALLSHDGIKNDFILGGLGGSSPVAQEILLEKKLWKYNPDIIVYEIYDNDLRDDYVFLHSSSYALMEQYAGVPDSLSRSYIMSEIIRFRAEKLTSYRESLYTDRSPYDDFFRTHWEDVTKVSLDRILHSARERDVLFVLMYIPGLNVIEPNIKEGIDNPGEKYMLEEFVREWADNHSVPLVNLYTEFITRDTEIAGEFYLPEEKGYHLTMRGADIAAEGLHDEIIRLQRRMNSQ